MPAYGAILLGEVAQHLATVHISCSFYPRQGQASIIRLMQEHGPEMPVPDTAHAVTRLPEVPGRQDL